MKKKICFVALLMIFIIPFMVLASTGNFALRLGQKEVSTAEKMKKDYPVVEVNNNNTSVDGQLAVSIERKKNIFGAYEFVARQSQWMKNYSKYTFGFYDYNEYNETCRTVILNNAMNGDGYLSGSYNLYSEN